MERGNKSIKGLRFNSFTSTGGKAKLLVHTFKNGDIRIQHTLFVEPDYETSNLEICLRATKNYKLITRMLMLKGSTASHLITMILQLKEYRTNYLVKELVNKK